MTLIRCNHGWLICCCLSVFLGACLKSDNLPDLTLEASSPHLAFPLISATLTTQDLVAEIKGSSEITVNDDGIYHALFDAEPFIRSKPDIFPKITFGLPIPILDSAVTVPIPSIAEADPDSAVFKGDSIFFVLNSFEDSDVKLDLSIPELRLNGMPFQMHYVIPYAGSSPSTLVTPKIGLQGYEVALAAGFLSLRYEARNAEGTRLVLPLSFVQIDAFDFSYIQGKIGRSVFSTNVDTIRVDTQDTLFDGTYHFTNPKIHFDITNSFGVPIGILVKEASLINANGAVSKITSSLFNDIKVISYPSLDDVGKATFDRITLDRDNSNIDEIAQDDIAEIVYEAEVIVNPTSLPDNGFFVTDSSEIRLDAKFDLSFEARVEEIIIHQDLAVVLEKLDSITSLRLKVIVQNGIPLHFTPSLALTGSEQKDTIPLVAEAPALITPASTDGLGNVTESSQSTFFYSLDATLLTQLRDLTQMLIKLSLQSPAAGTKPAIIRPNQSIDLRIGAEAQIR